MIDFRCTRRATLAVLSVGFLATPAYAQKNQDVARFPMTEPVPVISGYYSLGRENSFFLNAVHEGLIYHDAKGGRFAPLLAKSFKRVDPTTLEFELREDVKFHNGEPFTADDVIATLEFARERKNGVQLPNRFTWFKTIEKLGPYKLRFVSENANATDISNLESTYILNKKYLHGLAEPKDYGRAPVGTGPFKITMFDDNKGIMASRYDEYVGLVSKKARIKGVLGLPIHDKETQVLSLLTGKLDAVRDPNEDQLKEFGKDKNFATTSLPAMYMTYMMFDAAGLSGRTEMKDVRVRRAMVMAIDREALRKTVVSGGDTAQLMDGMCFREMIGCDYSTKPPAYNPAEAKRLMAEAGYPNGFNIELTARPATKDAAVAVTGYWRAIGINATVDLVNISGWRTKRNSGKVEAYFGERPMDEPDVSYAVDVLFSPKRDFSGDPMVLTVFDNGPAELDETKRKELYRTWFNRVNEQHYMLPMTTLPQTFIHSSDIEVATSKDIPYAVNVGVFGFKK